MSRANKKSIIEYQGQEIPITITYDGIRSKLNQYNELVMYREVRGKIVSSQTFVLDTIVILDGNEMKIIYYNNNVRPADISLTDNVIGL